MPSKKAPSTAARHAASVHFDRDGSRGRPLALVTIGAQISIASSVGAANEEGRRPAHWPGHAPSAVRPRYRADRARPPRLPLSDRRWRQEEVSEPVRRLFTVRKPLVGRRAGRPSGVRTGLRLPTRARGAASIVRGARGGGVRTVHRRALSWLARHGHLERLPLEQRSAPRRRRGACARGALGQFRHDTRPEPGAWREHTVESRQRISRRWHLRAEPGDALDGRQAPPLPSRPSECRGIEGPLAGDRSVPAARERARALHECDATCNEDALGRSSNQPATVGAPPLATREATRTS